jgi:hypothetical protein
VYTSIFQKKNDERIALVNQARSKKKWELFDPCKVVVFKT